MDEFELDQVIHPEIIESEIAERVANGLLQWIKESKKATIRGRDNRILFDSELNILVADFLEEYNLPDI